MDFEIEHIVIGGKSIERIRCEDKYWYPLKAFIRVILCKYEEVAQYRDNEFHKYMKVFYYRRANAVAPRRTWCMNQQGIRKLLRTTKINNGNDPLLADIRRRCLAEACLFFGIKRKDLDEDFIYQKPPKMNDYDFWSIMCIENDLKVTFTTRWRKCHHCSFYYPDSQKYFTSENEILTFKCHQCNNSNFKCDNQVLQFIKEHDGFELLWAIHNHDSDAILKEFVIFLNKGGYIINEN